MKDGSDSIRTVKVYLSYSAKDEGMKKQLDLHLGPMKRRGDIQSWDEQRILAGENREKEISLHFEEANLILCLISPDFIYSDYCYERELPRALEKKKNGEAKVIPILLKEVDWEKTPFGELGLQVLPRDKKAIKRPYNREKVLKEVALEIARVVGIINGKSM